MTKMTGSYDVFCGDTVCGRLDVSRAGAMTVLSCTCRAEGSGVMKLFSESRGKSVKIGVLAPENGKLCLKRSFSDEALRKMGVSSAERFFIAQALPERGSSWRSAAGADGLFNDRGLSDACRDLKGALIKTDGERTLFAVPCSGGPFPLMPVFRFGAPEEIDGGEYIVFTVENGEITE